MNAGREPAFSRALQRAAIEPDRCTLRAGPLRSPSRKLRYRGPVTGRLRSWGHAASRGLAPARAIPSSLAALLTSHRSDSALAARGVLPRA